MVPSAIGYGSGKKDFGTPFPNLLRVFIGEATDAIREETAKTDSVVVLETNVDDATPETLGYAQERLLAQGALDVFMVPAQMKKNRPGTLITVLATPESVEHLTETLFRETGTFGIRKTVAEREILERTIASVETRYGAVPIKVGSRKGSTVVAAPEYEDCRTLAQTHNIPLRDVYRTAWEAWSSQS
jgi:hypothetical protein